MAVMASSAVDRLYKARVQLIAVAAALVGLVLVLAYAAADAPDWLHVWPVEEIGRALFDVGLVAVVFEYILRTDGDDRATERLDAALDRKMPALLDEAIVRNASALTTATLAAFTGDDAALRMLAPSVVREIAVNALGVLVNDPELGRTVVAETVEQVAAAPEIWRDVAVLVDIDPWADGPVSGPDSMFAVTLRCDYRVIPSRPVLRFTCTTDHDLYVANSGDETNASSWYVDSVAPVEVTSPAMFVVLKASVDGHPARIERVCGERSQTYTVTLPESAMSGAEVVLSYAYRVLVRRNAHQLCIDLARPTKGFSATVTYGHAGIYSLFAKDYLPSATSPTRVMPTPAEVSVRAVTVQRDGWIRPGDGVAVVWTLRDEVYLPESESETGGASPDA